MELGSAGWEWRCAACGEARCDVGLRRETGNENLAALIQANDRGQMDTQRWGRVERDADSAMVWRSLIEQRMHVADRQHHGQQHQEDAGGDGDFTDPTWRVRLHRF